MSKARAFTFTINDFDENTEEFLQGLECRYIIYGYEIAPVSGRPHLQGYVYFDNPRSFKAVTKLIKGHIETAKGAPEQNYDYCSKDGNFFERGQRPLSDKAQRVANQERYRLALDAAREGRFSDIPPDLYTRHRSTYHDIHTQRPHDPLPLLANLHPWQASLVNEVAAEPHPRSIIWYVDHLGGQGKSAITNHLVDQGLAQSISNGSSANMFYLIDRPRVVLLDFTRDVEERVNYGALEAIKNGRVMSTKYQPVYKVFPTPHVVVFSNFEPDQSKFSADRWDIRRL